MGQHRTSATVLALNGATKQEARLGRERANEPKPIAMGRDEPAPMTFSTAERMAWGEILASAPARVLTMGDRPFLVCMARLYALCLMPSINPHTGEPEPINPRTAQACIGMLARIGMTPVDRPKVQFVPDEDPGTRYGEF